ncbi:MAG TPA: alanine--tRNA ligase [Actinomycetota bacterium]|jgi:alanyl-tRNA synthetase|nr:alanine--tRNA ligase [Actinomycetota bacterium]
MEGRRIRESFLRFFEERGHRGVPSSSLIPPPDSGLLLTNAGMNQFIPYFLGHAPAPFPRAVTVQKCFRALDIENVGHTDRHLTFFEMLGNFSFGDYFKRGSCAWGLELVTEVWGIDPDRLWVTVFETDEETIDVWRELGIPRERIVRRGKDDNYWWTHAAGPAGPCSEIFVDRGPRYGQEGGPDVDEDRHLEIWNHVFMQDEVDDQATILRELPAKNIDTGASLERVATVLQDVANVFETDLLRPLLEVAESLSGRTHGQDDRTDVSLKVIAEHGRATAFLIADGVQPSNEGRGYLLRRMLRRVVSHARRLGIEKDVMPPLVERTVELFGDAYPELVENRAYVDQVAMSEEERFAGTLRQGMTMFEEELGEAPAGQLPGDVVFKLHDTFGFPKELTRELAQDAGFDIDEDRFEALMAEQRERAKRGAKRGRAEEELAQVAAQAGRTEFVGYDRLEEEASLVALFAEGGRVPAAHEGAEIRFVLDRTPFYAESGGQIGDRGVVRTPGGTIRVTDTRFGPGEVIVHTGVVDLGEIRQGEEVHGEVDVHRREATARSHTATHVVHWTLKHLLGEHARQAGSLVAPGRLRFDFPHHSAVGWDALEQAEEIANAKTAADDLVTIYETTFEEAKNQGAIALFGEKYGDLVRVVEVGDYSVELCGGTHVHHTGRIGVVRILQEGSIGAGMRRVEAVVGPDALREINLEREWLRAVSQALGTGPRSAADRARQLVERVKRLESEQGKKEKERQRELAAGIATTAREVAGARLVTRAEDLPADALRALAQDVTNRLESDRGAAVVLGTGRDGKALLVAACSKNLQARGVTAPDLLRPAGAIVGGSAGGKPGLGFSGGPKGDSFREALEAIEPRLEELLGAGG